ncbi:MAG TPA: GxxExxY protein [Phycisphaerae bacterium]|nr:GxxExxY protein [Caldilineaceae bacterium]MCB9866966.1 GxxExxY protein [Phycisphaerales bacterium]HRX83978.1 GxxExxY protein [Phycisphaerae bacterium]
MPDPLNALTESIIGAAIDVHRELGPGLLESAYRHCFAHELGVRGTRFQSELPLPVRYKGVQLDCGYRLDFLVEDAVIVELKCVEALAAIHKAQLLSYLRLADRRVGLLFNFHVPVLMQGGMKRLVNDYKEEY